MSKYIAIDPGKNGAIVYRDKNLPESKIKIHTMPLIKKELDYHALNKIITSLAGDNSDVVLVIEKVGVIFGTSKTTAFSMGHQSGAIEMCAVANRYKYVLVPPKTWQKDIFLGIPVISKAKSSANDTKAMALVAANRMFNPEMLRTNPKNKPHDGIVDALLISEFACRNNL
jgi:hypothetical protein